MVLSVSSDDALFKMHQDLCGKLNLDPNIAITSWEMFEKINKRFELEGEKLHWMGCSIYVASQGVETPTLDTSNVVKGMGVNLTMLLRHSNLSFSLFFQRIKRWDSMTQLSEEFSQKINNLENIFSIAYNVFKSFDPSFNSIFMLPTPNELDIDAGKHRNRKNRLIPCTPLTIFEFIWNLYIVMKSEEPVCSIDLIKSHHLLYCCIDLAFRNVVEMKHNDVLNAVTIQEIANNNLKGSNEVPCLVKRFCKCESEIKEALHMKVYGFNQLLNKLVENKTLKTNRSEFTGIFDADNFDHNYRSLVKAYETHLLSHGDFDEKIFLAEHKRLLMEREQAAHWTNMRVLPQTDMSDVAALESPRNRPSLMATPLSGRLHLIPAENDVPDRSTPENISRVLSLTSGRTSEPTESFKKIFEPREHEVLTRIKNIVAAMTVKFIEGYRAVTQSDTSEDDAKRKADLATTLLYKYVELIFKRERSISLDIMSVIDKDIFYQCTFACCLDMVLFCYNFPKKFPWSIEVLEIQPIQFVKVIELVVRCKDNLFRELIKHLNRIEETVMESLAWTSDSLIWQAIERSGQPIPRYKEIALPGQLLYKDDQVKLQRSPLSAETLQSPMSQVCKNLFPSTGQSVLHVQKHLYVPGKDGNMQLIQLMDTEKKNGNQPASSSTTPEPQSSRRTGGLAIFYRKFYNLGYLRLEDLCDKLKFSFELKRKIWTLFEDSIIHTQLIKDRHLDQLLMCAIYVICKANSVQPENQTLFTLIMKFYRQQPQAASSVYRNVLVKKNATEANTIEERSDLIYFYNSVYVPEMQEYAVKFLYNSNANNNIELSPLPASRNNLVSPNMPVLGNVYVRTLEEAYVLKGPTLDYIFSRSPSKDWKAINRVINGNGIQGKRLLTEEDNEMPNSKRVSNRKIQSLVEDRRRQNAE